MTQRDDSPKQDEQQQNYSSEDVQRVLQVGEHATQVLGSPVYNLAYRNVVDQMVQDWMNSKPKETMLRESLYNQTQGLIQVTERLAAAAEEAKRVLSDQAAQNDPDQHRADYLNNQGFGIN